MSPIDWNERYRLGDTPWEKGRAHPVLADAHSRYDLRGRILVPGCGSGHDVRAVAIGGAEVIGLDLAPAAFQSAQSHPPVGHETYIVGDLFAPPADWLGTFDWIVEHTCFCAIPPARRPDYARSVASLLKPGGYLLAIFFLNPDHDQDSPPYGCSLDELDHHFSPFFRVEEEQKNLPTYEGREHRELLRVLRLR